MRTSLPVFHWIGINQSLPFRALSFAPITANCKCQRVAKAKGPGRGRRQGHFGAAWWPGQPRCSEAGAGQSRRAERVGSGAVPRGAGTGSGAPGTSAERRPGLRWLPAPRPSPPRSRDGLFGREGGRGLPFLREVPSLARETFYVPVRERQLVALTEVRGVFGFSRTSLLLHLPPRPEFPLPFCSELRFICVWRKGWGGRLVGGCSVFCQRSSAKGEPRLGEGTRINK